MAAITIKDIEKVVKVDGKATVQSISRLTAPGENYLSVVYKVDFLVEKNGKTSTLSTVLKRIPPNATATGDFNSLAMENEIIVYKSLIPLLKKYGNEYGLTVDFFPEYLGSRLSLQGDTIDDEAALLLKNLIPDGYKNEDRTVGFDLTLSKNALSALATFHAIPLLLKFKNPKAFQELKDILDRLRSLTPPGPPPGDKPGPPEVGAGPPHDFIPPDVVLMNKLQSLPEFAKYHSHIENFKKNPKTMQDIHLAKGPEPWNTIVHNDYWGNNMMVNPKGKPPVIILDFQGLAYSSFAKDLSFFLLTTAQDNVLKNNFDELLRHYYDEFTSIFEKWNVSELKLTYEDFVEEVERTIRDTEFLHSIFFCVILNVEKTGIPDFHSGEVNFVDHINNTMNNINERQKTKLKLIFDIASSKNWI